MLKTQVGSSPLSWNHNSNLSAYVSSWSFPHPAVIRKFPTIPLLNWMLHCLWSIQLKKKKERNENLHLQDARIREQTRCSSLLLYCHVQWTSCWRPRGEPLKMVSDGGFERLQLSRTSARHAPVFARVRKCHALLIKHDRCGPQQEQGFTHGADWEPPHHQSAHRCPKQTHDNLDNMTHTNKKALTLF